MTHTITGVSVASDASTIQMVTHTKSMHCDTTTTSLPASYLTVVMALNVWEATPTIAELALAASFSMIFVCCLYKAATAPVEMITQARMGPRRQDKANSTAT